MAWAASTSAEAQTHGGNTPEHGARSLSLDAPRQLDLAGNPLSSYPFFEFVRAFIEGKPLSIAIDPAATPALVGATLDVFVVAHRSALEWAADPVLLDLTGGAHAITLQPGGIQNNTFTVDTGFLEGNALLDLGIPYDVVLDVDRDGMLGGRDYIDGSDAEAGFYMCVPTENPGPLVVNEVIYSGGTFLGQDLYYPQNIAGMGRVPLVVVSHGNGHNYTWYDHIGYHLASWGCIVMSHTNDTAPGIETASTTTLTNTEYILTNQATIAGGAINGHIDSHRIVWIGHSRGGEGVVRAYDRIFDGQYTPLHFALSDIVLISSIAPTDFLGTASSNPHAVNYHLWVGGADADVTGCADCALCQSFHLLDRSIGTHQSISLHGVGHGAFHDGGGSTVATGPCLLSRADTHLIMKGYLLPLVKRYTAGNIPAKDFLWRQWERFQPTGVPTNSCVVVDLQYKDGPAAGNFVIDDFQTQTASNVSSSGGGVTFDVESSSEGVLRDVNTSFTTGATEPFNGFTEGTSTDTTRGVVFQYSTVDRTYTESILAGQRDFRPYAYLSFRACQATRHSATTAALGDLTFTVALRDGSGRSSSINIGAYGGGIEEPYQRTSCGTGAGWGNEFETVRMRLSDFARNASGLDLSDIAQIDFQFGASFGSSTGRVGLDDIELSRD